MDTIAAMTATDDRRDAFSALLQRHRGIVFKVANTYARLAEDRDDLAQEIAARLWHAYPKYDPARSFSTQQSCTWSRACSHDAVPLDEGMHDLADAGGMDHERDQHIRLLQGFIQRQPPLERALLLLYLEDRPQREIAEILGLTENNVSTKIGRLKQRIRDEP